MKLLKIKYKKEGQLLERVMKVLVEENVLVGDLHDIVQSQILNDLGITMYEWCIINSGEVEK